MIFFVFFGPQFIELTADVSKIMLCNRKNLSGCSSYGLLALRSSRRALVAASIACYDIPGITRAITQSLQKDEFRLEIFDLTAGVYFYFNKDGH